ncbi:MAG TPA: serine/threonine-protein kinase [Desulfuromonadaceae bacterium]|nr:serine/threonine-protein kinase [Desulfuromonadaceae bacterium]
MNTKRICPGCQNPLPPDAPAGLCPECLLKAGFGTGTEPGGEGTGFVAPTAEQVARLFPQLEILGLIGKGGMGAVYKARQPGLDRLVALKILPPGVADAPGFPERFNREARALARLVHPNIVAVHDFGQAGGLHYLIMEFVDGANLRGVERAGRLAPEQALAIVPQICEALQFAHNEGVVHRDIKPENILVDKKGRVKITDFGIAKILGVPAEKGSLTGAKDVIGTPHYMAPEQIEHPALVDHRADIFSLGVVFYEMLTGELPLGKFQAPSKKVQMDVRLDEVVLHALEKEPERRYQHASEVKTDVETIATSPENQLRQGALPGTATSHELNRTDFLLTGISLLLCLSGLIMGFSSPPGFGIPVVVWGVLGFVATMRALFGRRDFYGQVTNLNQGLAAIRTAGQIVLVHGIGISAAGLVVAFKYAALSPPFIAFIAVACILGIVVCLLKLAGLWPFPSGLFPGSTFTKRNLPSASRQGRATDRASYNSSELAMIALGTIFFIVFLFVTRQLPHPLGQTFLIVDIFGLCICALSIAGFWPFPSIFTRPDFSCRNLPEKPTSLADNIKCFLARLVALLISTVALTEIAIHISGRWRESDQERWFIPFALYAGFASVWVVWHFFGAPRSFGKSFAGIIGFFLSFGALFAAGDFYGNWIVPRYVHPEMREEMEISFGRARSPRADSSNAEATVRFEKSIVEDLALQVLVAIREKDDRKLQSLATDSVKTGWRDALPTFALETRERFLEMTGKPFLMFPAESRVEGDSAAVKCTGPKELNGIYLVLVFSKTSEGWKNCWLRNSTAATPLAQHLDNFRKEVPKPESDSSGRPPK